MINSQPPRVADWLLNLFVQAHQAPQILGDLREEFSALASRGRLRYARRWYWRQTVKTVPHLFYAQLAQKPWQALATVVIGMFLLWLTNLPHVAIERNYYPADWPEWLRFAWLLVFSPVNSLLPGILVGWIVTRVGKTLAGTILLSLSNFSSLSATLLIVASYFSAPGHGRLGGPPPIWSLFWLTNPLYSIFWLANPSAAFLASIGTLLGGYIARKTAPALPQTAKSLS
jgi:hypothetical protein